MKSQMKGETADKTDYHHKIKKYKPEFLIFVSGLLSRGSTWREDLLLQRFWD